MLLQQLLHNSFTHLNTMLFLQSFSDISLGEVGPQHFLSHRITGGVVLEHIQKQSPQKGHTRE